MKIEVEWELLERIAKYYEFPSSVFLTNSKIFPKSKTRQEIFRNKAELFDKIKEIVKGEVK